MDVDSTTSTQAPKQITPSGMTNMTPDDYRDIFWSMLRDAIDQMLTHPPGSYKPISYEQVSNLYSVPKRKHLILNLSRCTQQCTSVCASSTVNSFMLTSSLMSSKNIRNFYQDFVIFAPGPGLASGPPISHRWMMRLSSMSFTRFADNLVF